MYCTDVNNDLTYLLYSNIFLLEDMVLDVLATGTQQLRHVLDSLPYYFGCTVM
jgi:hypothetical protein